MIIGIDYRFAITNVRGIGYYIKSVVQELIIIDIKHTYYLYVDEEISVDLPPNFKAVVIHCKNIFLFEQYYLPKQAKKDSVELLWYPSNSGPIFLNHNIKLLVTIHDMVSFNSCISALDFLKLSKLKFLLGQKYRGLALKYGLNRINDIITVSNYSANEITRQLYRRAHVIYNQVHLLQKLENQDEILRRLGLAKKRYFYTVTGTAPHKNLSAYIDLFSNGEIQLPMVISGVFDAKIIENNRSEHIIFSDFLTENEKATLYANARAFLFLSLEEGFGLPLIEAMQFRIPIISSNRGALPEVLGDAGILIDPTDLTTIRKELLAISIANDNEMNSKQQLQYVKFNNWKNAAKAHLNLFNSYAK